MKKRYEFVEHTADVEYIAHGKDIEEVFSNAFLALFDTIADIRKLSKASTGVHVFSVNERAREPEDLLWFALQDALSVADAEGLYSFAVKKINIGSEMGEYSLDAVIEARKKDPKYSKLDVKGVSKFDMAVTKKGTGYTAEVVLDV